MKYFLLFVIAFLSVTTEAQVTWANDVAEIFYNNCTQCHHNNGIAPFSLMQYQDALDNDSHIDDVVESGEMPPWIADTEYQEYAHERVLTQEEIATILQWMDLDMPAGDLADAPPAPIYPEDGFIALAPDVEVQIPEYTSQASSSADDYVCFSMPLGLSTDKKLRAFEVVPGNGHIVHHALLYIDSTGTYPTDTEGICVGPTDGLIGGYTPGAEPTIFPSDGEDINMGVTIPAGSNLVLALHYPEGSAGEVDNTKVRLYFYDDDTEIREIYTNPIIQNWNFILLPNQITPVSAQLGPMPIDFSVLSVFPHMHLLGNEIKSYAISSEGDTTNFVHIPHWNFEWQQFYFFNQIQHITAGSTIYGEGSFDNTTDNEFNPNNPPVLVFPGLNTSDEMFLVYFHFLPYEEGDEDINLAELTSLPTFLNELNNTSESSIATYPNPFHYATSIEITLKKAAKVSLFIYDNQGRLVDKLAEKSNLPSGVHLFKWQPETDLPNGLYHFSALINGESKSGMLVKGE